jgi:integrase
VYALSMHIFGGGERVPMLHDARGLPLFYPTLFVTSQLRNAGAAVNTIVNTLRDILVLLRWEASQTPTRNLEREFSKGSFLTVADVVSLRDFASLDMRFLEDTNRGGKTSLSNVRLLEAHTATVSSSPTIEGRQHYNRMSSIADYVEFLGSAITQHQSSPKFAAEIARMTRLIRKHRPCGIALRPHEDPEEKSPPTELVERFMAVVAHESPENPFRDASVRLRNAILFALLQYTGIRRGELLSLRIDQIDLGDEPQVWVRRNHDDLLDSRRYQPLAKTKERPIPIPEGLANLIHENVMKHRARIKSARQHPYLLVTHHKGEHWGKPLSLSSVGRIMETMRSVDEAFGDIHPHAFRHHFNYELSVAIDAHNARARQGAASGEQSFVSEGRELDIRAFLAGHWSKASGAVYNKRHIREVSDKAVRELQSGLGRIIRGRRVSS